MTTPERRSDSRAAAPRTGRAYLDAVLDPPGSVLALAHRGGAGHPDLDGLENTLTAFRHAVDAGYDYLETDVHVTADGVLLAFHDETLDRVTDGAGRIWDQPWHRVREARIGGTEQIPTLDELFETWPRLRVNIDIKSEPAVLPLVECVERHRAWDRVCVTSFSDRRRRAALRRLSKPVATSGGQSVTTAFVLAANSRVPGAVRAALRGVDCLQVPVSHKGIPVVTPRTIAAAHAVGVQVHVWTVNESDEMRRLLDLGVDGLITDRADLLRQVLTERGEWAERGW